MSIPAIVHLLRAIQRDPFAHLSARDPRSLAAYLAGRSVALDNLGLHGWSDLPIARLVEAQHRVPPRPWQSWIDLLEHFANDEHEAFNQLLLLCLSQPHVSVATPKATAPQRSFSTIVDELEAHPAQHLAEPTIARVADFVRGVIDTTMAASTHTDPEITSYRAFTTALGDTYAVAPKRPWWKSLRFAFPSEREALDEFWEQRRAWRATGRLTPQR